MTALETRWRRLLAVYPSDHRAKYGEEMLGVLMAASRPGQRVPAARDALDVAWSGLRLRVARWWEPGRGGAWAAAGTIVGAVCTIFLLTLAVQRFLLIVHRAQPTPWVLVDEPLAAEVVVRAATWLVVAVALIAGWRRPAALAAVVAAGAEVAANLASWAAQGEGGFLLSWNLTTALLTAACLLVGVGAGSLRASLRLGGTVLVVAASVAAALLNGPLIALPSWLASPLPLDDLYRSTLPGAGLCLAGIVLVLGLRCAAPPVRQRAYVLVAPLLVIHLARGLLWAPAPGSPVVTQVGLILAGTLVPVFAAWATLRARDGVRAHR